jgi:hypothetical protein
VAGGVGLMVSADHACQGRLQLYLSAVDISSVDGELEAQESAFADGTFGLEYPTTLTGWNAGLDNEVLCSGLSQLRSSAGTISCVDCEGPLADGEGELCADPDTESTLEKNKCEALNSVALCESFPPARRPTSGP